MPLFNTSNVLDIWNDEEIEGSATAMAKVCFVVCIIFCMGHLCIIDGISRLRILYGIHLLTCLHLMLASYILTLVSCSMTASANDKIQLSEGWNIVTQVVVSLAHFTYLSAPIWSLMAVLHNWTAVYRGCHDANTAGNRLFKLSRYLVASIFGFGLPFILVLIGHLMRTYRTPLTPTANQFTSTESLPTTNNSKTLSITSSSKNQQVWQNEYNSVVCGICSLSPAIIYPFFLPIFVVLWAQLILLASVYKMSGSKSGREDRQLIVQDRCMSVHLGMTVKLSISSLLLWTSALLSVVLRLVSVWHIFTLFSALQSIYIAVNFTLTRPVLDLFRQWRDAKAEANGRGVGMACVTNNGSLASVIPDDTPCNVPDAYCPMRQIERQKIAMLEKQRMQSYSEVDTDDQFDLCSAV